MVARHDHQPEFFEAFAVDPFGYLRSTLTALVNGHKQSQIEHLLPWNSRVG